MPTARSKLAVGVVNNKIYAIGGEPSGGGTTNIVQEYNPSTNTWTNCSTGCASMPTSRIVFAIGVVNNKIYASGGRSGSYLATVEEYDPATNMWTTKASMPAARDYLGVGVVNNKIYAIGGHNGGVVVDTVYEYNPLTNTWTNCGGTCTSMPTARYALAVGVVGSKIYAIGGENSGALATVEEGTVGP